MARIAKKATKAKNTIIDHKTGKPMQEIGLKRRKHLADLTEMGTGELFEKGRDEFAQVATLSRGMIQHSIELGLVIEALHQKKVQGKTIAKELGIDTALVTKFRRISTLDGVPLEMLPTNYEVAYRLLTQKDPKTQKPVIQSASDFVEHAKKQESGSFAGIKNKDVPASLGVAKTEPAKPKTALQKAKSEVPGHLVSLWELLNGLPPKRKGVAEAKNALRTFNNAINNAMGVGTKKKATKAS